MLVKSLHIPPLYHFYLKLLGGLSIFLFFIIMRKFMHKFILGFFKKKPSKLSELFDDITTALDRPLDFLWVATGVYFAILASPFTKYTTLTQPPLIIGEIELSLDFIPFLFLNKGFSTLFIIGLTWGAYNFVDVYEKLLVHMGAKFTLLDNALIIRFTCKIIKFVILIIGLGVMIAQYTNLGNILTSVGIAGAAFTFIAKDTLMNIMSGVVLMIDSPFTIGDWVVIGNIEGTVEDVSFRSTRIRTFEQGLVVIPNATLANDNILNWSTMPKRRYRFSFGVGYSTSKEALTTFIDTIKVVLAEMDAIESESILVYFDNFGDYSLNITIQYFTHCTDLKGYSSVKEQVNLKLMELAKAQQIDIAFPTQTIFVQKDSDTL